MFVEPNLATLAQPFKLAEHGTVQNNPYIRKSAIRARLSKVDLFWSLGAPEYVCTDGDVVMYKGSLTVGGVIRWGLGTGIIQRLDAKKQPVDGFTLAKNVAKAHKTAVTDILARAAMEFGVGNYLRDKPWEAESITFREWITGDKPAAGQQSPQPVTAPPERKPWADRGSVQYVLNVCAQGSGLTWADVSRLTKIAELEDYPAWNKQYADPKDAVAGIKAALEKELSGLPPSKPKQAATTT